MKKKHRTNRRYSAEFKIRVERVLASFAEKLLFAISLAVFDNMVTFTYRARSNRIFFGIGGGFDTQLHQDKILDFAELVIGHPNHHLNQFIKQLLSCSCSRSVMLLPGSDA